MCLDRSSRRYIANSAPAAATIILLGDRYFSTTLSPETEQPVLAAYLTGICHMRLSVWVFEESNRMKKTYEKPVFVRKGKLSAIVAGSPVPG